MSGQKCFSKSCVHKNKKLLFCPLCKHASYCTRECQLEDYEKHKNICAMYHAERMLEKKYGPSDYDFDKFQMAAAEDTLLGRKKKKRKFDKFEEKAKDTGLVGDMEQDIKTLDMRRNFIKQRIQNLDDPDDRRILNQWADQSDTITSILYYLVIQTRGQSVTLANVLSQAYVVSYQRQLSLYVDVLDRYQNCKVRDQNKFYNIQQQVNKNFQDLQNIKLGEMDDEEENITYFKRQLNNMFEKFKKYEQDIEDFSEMVDDFCTENIGTENRVEIGANFKFAIDRKGIPENIVKWFVNTEDKQKDKAVLEVVLERGDSSKIDFEIGEIVKGRKVRIKSDAKDALIEGLEQPITDKIANWWQNARIPRLFIGIANDEKEQYRSNIWDNILKLLKSLSSLSITALGYVLNSVTYLMNVVGYIGSKVSATVSKSAIIKVMLTAGIMYSIYTYNVSVPPPTSIPLIGPGLQTSSGVVVLKQVTNTFIEKMYGIGLYAFKAFMNVLPAMLKLICAGFASSMADPYVKKFIIKNINGSLDRLDRPLKNRMIASGTYSIITNVIYYISSIACAYGLGFSYDLFGSIIGQLRGKFAWVIYNKAQPTPNTKDLLALPKTDNVLIQFPNGALIQATFSKEVTTDSIDKVFLPLNSSTQTKVSDEASNYLDVLNTPKQKLVEYDTEWEYDKVYDSPDKEFQFKLSRVDDDNVPLNQNLAVPLRSTESDRYRQMLKDSKIIAASDDTSLSEDRTTEDFIEDKFKLNDINAKPPLQVDNDDVQIPYKLANENNDNVDKLQTNQEFREKLNEHYNRGDMAYFTKSMALLALALSYT